MVEFVNAVDAFIDDYFNVKLPDVNITDIIEIVIISYFMYHLLVWIKNSRVWMLIRGVIFILIFFVFAAIFEMNTILWLGEKLVSVAVTVIGAVVTGGVVTVVVTFVFVVVVTAADVVFVVVVIKTRSPQSMAHLPL